MESSPKVMELTPQPMEMEHICTKVLNL